MTTYEYKDLRRVEANLKKLGAKGWLLVGVTPSDVLIFVRPLENS